MAIEFMTPVPLRRRTQFMVPSLFSQAATARGVNERTFPRSVKSQKPFLKATTHLCECERPDHDHFASDPAPLF